MAGELIITDGTTSIDLKTGLFRLVDWTPVTPPTKGGGIWQDSMLDDGRRLVMSKRDNAREVFSLRVASADMDSTIRETQELRRLLEKAKQYWTTNWQREPVWIQALGSCETNKRYAYVMDYLAERDDNPYQSPFYSDPLSTMDEWTLEIERSDWLNNPPGQGSCVAIASQQDWWSVTDTESVVPTQLEDDISVSLSAATSDNTLTTHRIGYDIVGTGSYGSGIRFRNLSIPAGAIIKYAFLQLVASDNDSGGTVSAQVYGELNAAPAAFGTGAAGFIDFVGRTRTTNRQIYTTTAAWTTPNTYSIAFGPDLIAILQEIIDLPGWAAGNDLALLIYDNKSTDYRRYASFDHAALTEPRLLIRWSENEVSGGMEATCSNAVYFANKHNQAQLSTAFYNRAAAWVDIMAAALPSALFPAIPAAGDILYIGINTALVDSGPFCSVIFDIGTAANDIIAVDWEYWNGGWANLTTDRTIDTVVPSEYFNVPGVGSVAFIQPTDWATTAVNGVTGYWIRCVIPAGGVGANPTAPTQARRLLYTVVRPSVDIDALQVPGDVSALARIKVHDYTTKYNSASVILAIRSQDRGDSFRMYLNASDEQNVGGVIFIDTPTVTIAANLSSPCGRCAHYNPGAGSTGTAYWRIDTSIASDYFGKYRAYLRVDRDSAVTDCTVKLSIGADDPLSSYVAYTYESEIKTISSGIPNYFIDFGVVDIPGFGALRDNETILPVILQLDFANTTATPNLYIYDLILIPVDEWAGEFSALDPNQPAECIGLLAAGGTEPTRIDVYLDVDSLNLKKRLSAYTRNNNGDLLQYSWKDITAAAAQLQANKDQQVYAMLKTYYPTTGPWVIPVAGVGTLEITAAARYLSMRGDK